MVRLWKPLWVVLLVFWPMPGKGIEFTDVPEDAWYRAELETLADLGAVSGVRSSSGEVIFEPDRLVTRAEFLKMCLQALAKGPRPNETTHYPAPDVPPFVDVPIAEWYAGYVAFAKQWGIADPTLPHFNPGASVTRRDAVRFLLKTLDLNGGAREVREGRFFPDAGANADIYTAFGAGLVDGYPDGTFRPDRVLNRAEAVILVARGVNNLYQLLTFRFEVTAVRSGNSPLGEFEIECPCPDLGIRLNRPEDSRNLLKVRLHGNPAPGGGTYYALHRTSDAIKVWPDRDKSQPAYLEDNDTHVFSFGVAEDVYVENVEEGDAVLSLELRRKSDDGIIASKKVWLHTFDHIVIVFGGRDQEPHTYNPDNPLACSGERCGIFAIGDGLYRLGYDVWLFDEEDVELGGRGGPYDFIRQSIEQREVSQVAILGYSWGGGATFELTEALSQDIDVILGQFELVFTTYVDAIHHWTNVEENRRPPGSKYHLNFFQQISCSDYLGYGLCSNRTKLLDGFVTENINVNETEWGKDLNHFDIDDDPFVSTTIFETIREQVQP